MPHMTSGAPCSLKMAAKVNYNPFNPHTDPRNGSGVTQAAFIIHKVRSYQVPSVVRGVNFKPVIYTGVT